MLQRLLSKAVVMRVLKLMDVELVWITQGLDHREEMLLEAVVGSVAATEVAEEVEVVADSEATGEVAEGVVGALVTVEEEVVTEVVVSCDSL